MKVKYFFKKMTFILLLKLLCDAVNTNLTGSATLSNYESPGVSRGIHHSFLNNAFIVKYLQEADVVKLISL